MACRRLPARLAKFFESRVSQRVQFKPTQLFQLVVNHISYRTVAKVCYNIPVIQGPLKG